MDDNTNNANEDPPPPSSVLGEPDEDDATTTTDPIILPSAPTLTLKEQLVHRERQRRIETERARWKQQFVLTNTTSTTPEASVPTDPAAGASAEPIESMYGSEDDAEEQTLGGESTKAHPDEESTERCVCFG